MREVNVTELRNQLPAYLERVRAGAELLITSRGKVVAKLVPVEDPAIGAKARLLEFRRRCRVGDVVWPVGEEWAVNDDPS